MMCKKQAKQALLSFQSMCKNFYNSLTLRSRSKAAQKHYDIVQNNILSKGSSVLRFGCYVVFDSTFALGSAFRTMLQQPEKWDAKIVIIPDISRGKENMEKTYRKTKQYFVNTYGQEYIEDGYDPDTGEFFDRFDEFDIIYFANPYDGMVDQRHSIKQAAKRNVLPVYINYGYDVGMLTTKPRLCSPELNLVWRYYTDTTYSYEDIIKYQPIKGANVRLIGYAKMDAYAKTTPKEKKRKKY